MAHKPLPLLTASNMKAARNFGSFPILEDREKITLYMCILCTVHAVPNFQLQVENFRVFTTCSRSYKCVYTKLPVTYNQSRIVMIKSCVCE